MLYGAMNFPVRPVLEELEIVGSLGFDYVELTMDPPQAHHSTIARERVAIERLLQRHNMQVVCHLPTFLYTADLTESIRAASVREFLDSLAVAASLRPLKVVLHPSYVTGLGSLVADRVKQYAMESLSAILERAEELGLRVCLENMFPRTKSLVEPDGFAEIFDTFPALKMTLDTGHANIGGKGCQRTLEFIHRFPDRIEHVHASDNFGQDDNHLPIGAGTVEFQRIIKALQGIGYDETVTFEVFSRDKDYLTVSRNKFAAMLASC
jgi:sugar phosphate isomerase/epimerase